MVQVEVTGTVTKIICATCVHNTTIEVEDVDQFKNYNCLLLMYIYTAHYKSITYKYIYTDQMLKYNARAQHRVRYNE